MKNQNRHKTEKQKQLAIRKRQLIDFRRWVALEGSGDATAEYVGMNIFDFRKHIEALWQPGMKEGEFLK